jgi:hypothetical protein
MDADRGFHGATGKVAITFHPPAAAPPYRCVPASPPAGRPPSDRRRHRPAAPIGFACRRASGPGRAPARDARRPTQPGGCPLAGEPKSTSRAAGRGHQAEGPAGTRGIWAKGERCRGPLSVTGCVTACARPPLARWPRTCAGCRRVKGEVRHEPADAIATTGADQD